MTDLRESKIGSKSFQGLLIFLLIEQTKLIFLHTLATKFNEINI